MESLRVLPNINTNAIHKHISQLQDSSTWGLRDDSVEKNRLEQLSLNLLYLGKEVRGKAICV